MVHNFAYVVGKIRPKLPIRNDKSCWSGERLKCPYFKVLLKNLTPVCGTSKTSFTVVAALYWYTYGIYLVLYKFLESYSITSPNLTQSVQDLWRFLIHWRN